MNKHSSYVLLAYLQKVAEINPQVGKEVQLLSSSIKNRIDRVKQKIEKPKDQNFNNSAGSSGPIKNFNNPQTTSTPNTNSSVTGPGSIPANTMVQNFQSNFAPLNNTPIQANQPPQMFGKRTNLFGRG